MKSQIVSILKSFLSEDIIKAIVVALGDYLVAKSSNQLDDKLWAKVKEKLGQWLIQVSYLTKEGL